MIEYCAEVSLKLANLLDTILGDFKIDEDF